MKILAVGAHPDDIELLCAGTLARYREEGHQVGMVVATNGELASATLSATEIAHVRRQEASRSAEILGATLIWLDFPDGFLFSDRETRLRFIDALRQMDPDVVLAHSPADYHPDHRAVGQIVADVRQLASARLIQTAESPTTKAPEILFMDTFGALEFAPDIFVDISPTVDIKRKMLGMHESQNAWLQDLHGMNYLEFMESHSRLRGLQAQTGYAEAFSPMQSYPAIGNVQALLPKDAAAAGGP